MNHSFLSAKEVQERLRVIIQRPPLPTAARGCSVLCTEQASRRLMIFNAEKDWNNPDALLWEWCPDRHPELPVREDWWFNAISEAKSKEGGKKILLTASGGAVALIDRATKKADFCGYAGGNTHSAEILPDGNIAAASSTGGYITLFHVEEGEVEPVGEPARIPYLDTHGVAWDKWQELLWVLGEREICGFRYTGTKSMPSLEKIYSIPLPEKAFCGHDLTFVPASRTLFLSASKALFLFDTVKREILSLADIDHVKSISLNRWAADSALIVQIPKEEWWSDEIFFLGKDRPAIGRYDGARFYKARFI